VRNVASATTRNGEAARVTIERQDSIDRRHGRGQDAARRPRPHVKVTRDQSKTIPTIPTIPERFRGQGSMRTRPKNTKKTRCRGGRDPGAPGGRDRGLSPARGDPIPRTWGLGPSADSSGTMPSRCSARCFETCPAPLSSSTRERPPTRSLQASSPSNTSRARLQC
jgi:hypothetical protein